MEIRQIVRGQNAELTKSRPGRSEQKGQTASARPAADRLELSRQWTEAMEEQRRQAQTALLEARSKEKKSDGLLDMLDASTGESEELDALSRQLDVQKKCMKIAANLMKGKRVPPEDERYLMEHDPEGYKLAMAMRAQGKEDDEECERVVKDEEEAEAGGGAGDGEAAAVPDGTASGESAASEAE